MGESSALHCSFCGKAQREVQTLIAGQSAFICDECVTLSAEVIADRKRAVRPITSASAEPADVARHLPEPVKRLILRSKARGWITYDELNAALPAEDSSLAELEEALSVFSALGIDLVETADGE
jgi:hypothetical protein